MKYFFILVIFLLSMNLVAKNSAIHVSNCFIKPCEIKGDFDGDGKEDIATLIKGDDEKKGIEFKLKSGKSYVVGAGKSIGHGGDNFSWMDQWEIHKGILEQNASEEPPPKNKGDSILVAKTGSASAIIYWSGSEFKWYQQGD